MGHDPGWLVWVGGGAVGHDPGWLVWMRGAVGHDWCGALGHVQAGWCGWGGLWGAWLMRGGGWKVRESGFKALAASWV